MCFIMSNGWPLWWEPESCQRSSGLISVFTVFYLFPCWHQLLFYMLYVRCICVLHICMCSVVVRAGLPVPVITIQTEQSNPFLSFCLFFSEGVLLRKPCIIFSSLRSTHLPFVNGLDTNWGPKHQWIPRSRPLGSTPHQVFCRCCCCCWGGVWKRCRLMPRS